MVEGERVRGKNVKLGRKKKIFFFICFVVDPAVCLLQHKFHCPRGTATRHQKLPGKLQTVAPAKVYRNVFPK